MLLNIEATARLINEHCARFKLSFFLFCCAIMTCTTSALVLSSGASFTTMIDRLYIGTFCCHCSNGEQWRVNGAAGSNAALQRNQFTVNWQKTSAPGAISFIDTGGTLKTLAVKLFHHSFGCLQLIKEFRSIRNATFNESARSTWCSVVKGRIGSKNSNIDENVHQANPRMANNFLRARFGIWLNFEEPNIDWGCRQTVDFSVTIIYVET